ncbi:MAG TPA: PTS sugar transporter subunit IIA [Thermoanaerobaculia bacterium]|nr:PTS sugar transporter subunit IIA [Thermoanaerobaculia bacterium]
MLRLEAENVLLGALAVSKEQAIRQVADLLVRSGFIEPGYADSMLARERVANTYLGQGIAIPHGLPKDRELMGMR